MPCVLESKLITGVNVIDLWGTGELLKVKLRPHLATLMIGSSFSSDPEKTKPAGNK